MATKAELLDIARQALEEGDEETANAAMDMIEKSTSMADVPVGEIPRDERSVEAEGSPIQDSISALNQFAAAGTRGAINAVDLLGMPIRAGLEAGTDLLNKGVGAITGEEYAPTEIPTLRESLTPYGIETNFMEASPTRSIIEAGGQAAAPSGLAGGLIRSVAPSAPFAAQGAENLLRGSALQIGKGTNVASDVGLGVLSGAGAGAGEEVAGTPGALIGGILSPTAGVVASKGIKGAAESAYSALTSPKGKVDLRGYKLIQSGDELKIESDSGYVKGRINDGEFKVSSVKVDKESRNSGEATKLYKKLIDVVHSKNLTFYSDSLVDGKVAKIYEGLKSDGYNVIENKTLMRISPDKNSPLGTYASSDDLPVFEVRPKKLPENRLPKDLSESDKIIQKLLQDAATGAGMSAKEVSAKVKGMGKEGMLADVDETFAALLRTSINESQNVRGFVKSELVKRQEGQARRIADKLDEDTGTVGLTLDEEVNRIETLLQPKIKQLYEEAAKSEINLSKKLNNMMNGETSLNKAYRNAQQSLKDIEAIGEPVTQMTVIDQTKKSLDDMISKAYREGSNEEGTRLVKMKKIMLEEVDQANPIYAQARQLASDKKSLQNAADLGLMFNKMKASELDDLVSTMGGSERHMYMLGAKQALLDRIDGIGQNRDLVNSMFGKNGDVRKLKTLFKDEQSFNNFRDTLKMEADWRLTSNTVRGNSTTKLQMTDSANAIQVAEDAARFATSPIDAARISGNLLAKLKGKRNEESYKQAMEKVGFILSQRGIEPDKVYELLKSGDEKRIKYFLDAVAPKVGIKEKITPAVIGSQTEKQQEAK